MSYQSIAPHRSMVFDHNRNAVFFDALQDVIKPGDKVMDLGAGLGIHGHMAKQLGASEVCFVDPSPVLLATEKMFAGQAGYRFVNTTIEEAALDRDYDVIVSVFTGNFLLSEDLLPSLFFARDNFLKDGGNLLPGTAKMMIAPVTTEAFFAENIQVWQQHCYDLPLERLQDYANNTLYFAKFDATTATLLAEPVCLKSLDFGVATDSSCKETVRVVADKSAVCHGFLGWFDATLGDRFLSTAPTAADTHWSQAFLTLPQPINIEAGEQLTFSLHRPEYGDWTWTISVRDETYRGSTFLGQFRSMAAMMKKSPNYKPVLSDKGAAMKHLLQQMNSGASGAELVSNLLSSFPELFGSESAARQFVVTAIDRYC